MAPKFAWFTKGSKLPLKKGFRNMFELLQSCAQPSNGLSQSLGKLRTILRKDLTIKLLHTKNFNLSTHWANSGDNKLIMFFSYFSKQIDLTFHVNNLLFE